jgi:hypothetical protein
MGSGKSLARELHRCSFCSGVTGFNGLRWLWRFAAVAALFALAVTPGPDPDAGAAETVVGYPRCTVDGGANGYIWYAGTEPMGVTNEPELQVGAAVHRAQEADCSRAARCLVHSAELSGRLATVTGTSSDDRLVGTPGRDLLVGGEGDDELVGRSGADLMCGGAGDDLIRGGRGGDLIVGGGGDDVVFAGRGHDDVHGGAGRDALYGQAGADTMAAGPGADSCVGGGGFDRLTDCLVEIPTAVRVGGATALGYDVDVEPGIGVGRLEVVAEVDRILADPRSWIADGLIGFRRTADGPDFTVLVASPDTVDAMCAPLWTAGYLSCRNESQIILNADRWTDATEWWEEGLDVYRAYLVNHEVGHVLGHQHVGCPGEGMPAPVMMQQTKGLGVCVANGWPYAEIAAG